MLKKALTVATLAGALALPAFADQAAVEARQSQFKLFAFNLGVLGGMAQGAVEYNADAAQTAADNLYHLTRHDQGRMWPEGSDNMAMDGTRALPGIWENLDDFAAKFAALQNGAEAMQGVAGDGLDALRGAIGGLAGACQACHQVYRGPAS